MIRSVPTPKNGRMGCSPGGGCCSECGDHGKLQATQCDDSGNCYTDGVLTAAPLTTGTGCAAGVTTCAASVFASVTPATWYVLGAGLLILMLEMSAGRR